MDHAFRSTNQGDTSPESLVYQVHGRAGDEVRLVLEEHLDEALDYFERPVTWPAARGPPLATGKPWPGSESTSCCTAARPVDPSGCKHNGM